MHCVGVGRGGGCVADKREGDRERPRGSGWVRDGKGGTVWRLGEEGPLRCTVGCSSWALALAFWGVLGRVLSCLADGPSRC